MGGRRAATITLSHRQREILVSIKQATTAPQRLAERARFVLWSADGLLCVEQAAQAGAEVNEQRVRRWRRRWAQAENRLGEAEREGASDKELRALIEGVLSDDYRCGVPPKFSAEQIAQLISLACEPPSDSGLPVSHWTPTELAQELARRAIVESISPRHVDRFLKGGGRSTAQNEVLADAQGRRPRAAQCRDPTGVRRVRGSSTAPRARCAPRELRREDGHPGT